MDDWITVDSKICRAKPVIRGTLITVGNVLGMIAGATRLTGFWKPTWN